MSALASLVCVACVGRRRATVLAHKIACWARHGEQVHCVDCVISLLEPHGLGNIFPLVVGFDVVDERRLKLKNIGEVAPVVVLRVALRDRAGGVGGVAVCDGRGEHGRGEHGRGSRRRCGMLVDELHMLDDAAEGVDELHVLDDAADGGGELIVLDDAADVGGKLIVLDDAADGGGKLIVLEDVADGGGLDDGEDAVVVVVQTGVVVGGGAWLAVYVDHGVQAGGVVEGAAWHVGHGLNRAADFVRALHFGFQS